MKKKAAVKFIAKEVKFYCLLVQYVCLKTRYFYLLLKYHCVKLGGAALIEAMEIWCSIKLMSNENRVIFAACIAVSIYGLALITLIRM